MPLAINDEEAECYSTLHEPSTREFYLGDSCPQRPWPKNIIFAEPFIYGPIVAPCDIRVLIIYPAEKEDDLIECVLTHQISSSAQYQALSYTWGDGRTIRKILCNGGVLSITENLYAALLDMRNSGDRDGISFVWADAICINQGDLSERESQVKIMRDIYRRAMATVVWIGPAVEDSARAFNLISHLSDAYENPDFQTLLQKDELDFGDLDHTSLGINDTLVELADWDALATFFSFSWFERIWICQEVAVAKEVFVMYGCRVRPWSFVVHAAHWLDRLHWEQAMPRGGLHYREALEIEQFRISQHDDGLSLLDLLRRSRNAKATDTLDKVFALRGIIGAGHTKDASLVDEFISYQQLPVNLYLNITLNLIQIHRTLDVLHLADNDPSSVVSWPSFVPDFGRSAAGRQMGGCRGRKEWEYHAAKETEVKFTFTKSFNLKGIIIDEIKKHGDEMIDMGYTYGRIMKSWYTVALLEEGTEFYTWKEIEDAKKRREGSVDLAGTQSDDNGESFPVINEQEMGEREQDISILLSKIDLAEKLGSEKLGSEISPSGAKGYPSGNTTGDAFWRTLIRNYDGTEKPPPASVGTTHFRPWFRACLGGFTEFFVAKGKEHATHGPRPVDTFNNWVNRASIGSSIFRTNKGYIGTGSRYARPKDLVCVLFGGQTPFILRRDEERYRFISDCYVYGIMEGEALDFGLEETTFALK